MNIGGRYGPMDRFLHRLAFGLTTAQQALADVEEILYGKRLSSVPVDNPVFISALPRAGTTILLRVLHGSGRFASHTYRDMPFVLCPLLWNRFSNLFLREKEPLERAHGDGMRVSHRTPEAFEEMIWKHFWGEHYRADRVVPWAKGEENPEFEEFLRAHIRKIVDLRGRDSPERKRYVSKNNLNLARLASRPGPLDGGTVLIPFRDPIQQAASLHQQHSRFLDIHREDDFVRRYMEAIGHHEFGRTLRPVDYGGWLSDATSPEELGFWVHYWTAAYRYVLKHADERVILISYDRLTAEPEPVLGQLAEAIDVPRGCLETQSDALRSPRTHEVELDSLSGERLDRARSLYGRLSRRSLAQSAKQGGVKTREE